MEVVVDPECLPPDFRTVADGLTDSERAVPVLSAEGSSKAQIARPWPIRETCAEHL